MPALLVLVVAALLAQPLEAHAQASASASSAPGSVEHMRFGLALESFYEHNWNRPYDRINLLRAYDTRADTFGIQQAAIVLERTTDAASGRRAGVRVDLQFGQATDTVQGSPANEPRPDVYRHVWQAYGTYIVPVGRGLRMDAGKFASSLGVETNYAKDNHHFSRADLFNVLPFYHAGLRATLPLTDAVTAMYALTNGVQQTEEFNAFKSSHLAAIVQPSSALSWTVNYYVGREQPDGGLPDGPDGSFTVFDTYVSWTPLSSLGLAADLNYVTNEVTQADDARTLQGVGLYARYQVSRPAALAVRYERLDDDGLVAGVDQVLHGATVTAEYVLAEGFLVRAEFRRDWSNRPVFTGRRPGAIREAQPTALVGLVWWFGNKPGMW